MTQQTKQILSQRRFILYEDGKRHQADEVDILDFIEQNSFREPEIRKIACLDFGETRRYGGGASPPFVLERLNLNKPQQTAGDCGCNTDKSIGDK